MKPKKLIMLAVLAAAVAGLFVWQRSPSLTTYRADKVAFGYPSTYRTGEKSKLASKHLESLVKLKASNPLAVIELYKESGAIIGANITKAPFLDYLDSVVDKNQAATRKDYRKDSSKRIKISDKDASRLTYSYLGPDKKTRLYINFFIIPIGNDAYYLTVGSPDQTKSNNDANKIQPTIKLL